MRQTNYIVVAAPGHYGDKTNVYSSHFTLRAAIRAARRIAGVVVYGGRERKGDTFLRSSAQFRSILFWS